MSGDISQAAAALHGAVSGLLAADMSPCGRDQLLTLLRQVDRELSRLTAVDARIVGELDARGVAAEVGARDTRALLMEQLRLSPVEATVRTSAARNYAYRRSLTGVELEPIYPSIASALSVGDVNAHQARVIVKTCEAVPEAIAGGYAGRGIEVSELVQQSLLGHASQIDSAGLARLGQRILAHLDPDGACPDDREHDRRRALTLHTRADGSAALAGELTPECALVWRTVLDHLAAPRPTAEPDPDEAPGQSVERDRRSPAQRRHDALLDAGQRILNSASLPWTGGVPVTLVVTTTDHQLASGAGYVTTEHDTLLSTRTALRLADCAEVTVVELASTGATKDFGTTRRLASPAQRTALIARDGGCSFPGCTVPPTWCQTHHVIPWRDGGATDLDNLTLVCGYHHREFDRRGWECRMVEGVPEWVPPQYLDPVRTPRRNRAHHQPVLPHDLERPRDLEPLPDPTAARTA